MMMRLRLMMFAAVSVQLLLLLVLPATVHGHGCPSFQVTDANSLSYFTSNFQQSIPDTFLSWINEQAAIDGATINGVVDCHDGEGDHELGYTGGCSVTADGDNECVCAATYNGESCQTCMLNCSTGTDGTDLSESTFSADCSNVQSSVGGSCLVGCDFATTECFVSDMSSAVLSRTTIVSCTLVWMGMLAAAGS